MAAEARRSRETQTLEKELAQDAVKRAEWEQQQIAAERKEQLYTNLIFADIIDQWIFKAARLFIRRTDQGLPWKTNGHCEVKNNTKYQDWRGDDSHMLHDRGYLAVNSPVPDWNNEEDIEAKKTSSHHVHKLQNYLEDVHKVKLEAQSSQGGNADDY